MTPRVATDLPRVFSYVVKFDGGFSPNPFHGWCTLACCKPMLRRSARPGDLVIGLSSRCERVVYVMKVRERLSFQDYWADKRFAKKKPDWDSHRAVARLGDNIYQPDEHGGFHQKRSAHWDHKRGREHAGAMRRDLGGEFALASREFTYFGADGPELPQQLDFLHIQRGHRCRFTAEQVRAVMLWIDSLKRGVRGPPTGWPSGDRTWSPRCGSS